MVARRILSYRHQLVASPAYLKKLKPPQTPQDLLSHRLFSFMRRGKPESTWRFAHANREEKESINFQPFLSMNDYGGLATAVLTGSGIGELPPIVQPHLLRDGRLIEVMPKWRFRTLNLWLVHLGNRYAPRPVREFREFAALMAPKLFPELPK